MGVQGNRVQLRRDMRVQATFAAELFGVAA
jgi:hypothetical protein